MTVNGNVPDDVTEHVAGAALSEDQANAGTFAFVAAVFGYPLWLVGLGVASWVLVRRQERGWALFVAVIASLPVLTLLGVTLGAGVETKITESITARTEYRFTNYQTQTFDLDSGARDRGFKEHQVSVGLGMRF